MVVALGALGAHTPHPPRPLPGRFLQAAAAQLRRRCLVYRNRRERASSAGSSGARQGSLAAFRLPLCCEALALRFSRRVTLRMSVSYLRNSRPRLMGLRLRPRRWREPGGESGMVSVADSPSSATRAGLRANCRLLPVTMPSVVSQQHDLLHDAREDPFAEEHEANPGETLHQVASDAGGIVHGKQLRRENEAETSPRLEKQCCVDRERSP